MWVYSFLYLAAKQWSVWEWIVFFYSCFHFQDIFKFQIPYSLNLVLWTHLPYFSLMVFTCYWLCFSCLHQTVLLFFLGCCHRRRQPWVRHTALLSVWRLWHAGPAPSLQNPPSDRRAVCLPGYRSRLGADGPRHSHQSWRSSEWASLRNNQCCVKTWFSVLIHQNLLPALWSKQDGKVALNSLFSFFTFQMTGRPERSNVCAHRGRRPEW